VVRNRSSKTPRYIPQGG